MCIRVKSLIIVNIIKIIVLNNSNFWLQMVAKQNDMFNRDM